MADSDTVMTQRVSQHPSSLLSMVESDIVSYLRMWVCTFPPSTWLTQMSCHTSASECVPIFPWYGWSRHSVITQNVSLYSSFLLIVADMPQYVSLHLSSFLLMADSDTLTYLSMWVYTHSPSELAQTPCYSMWVYALPPSSNMPDVDIPLFAQDVSLHPFSFST
jgi:hypothetical protein